MGLSALSTLVLVAVLPWALELTMLGVAWVGVAAVHASRRLERPRRLTLDRAGGVSIDGVRGRLRDGSFVAPWLAAVRWRPEGAWLDRSLLVAPDMLDAESFRRLRVLLRFGDGKPVPESG